MKVVDEIFECYLEEPPNQQYDFYCTTRDLFRLIGYIEGVEATLKTLKVLNDDSSNS